VDGSTAEDLRARAGDGSVEGAEERLEPAAEREDFAMPRGARAAGAGLSTTAWKNVSKSSGSHARGVGRLGFAGGSCGHVSAY
jgi:hypothetical protein